MKLIWYPILVMHDKELNKFRFSYTQWHGEESKFLHKMNPVRITYVIEMIKKYYRIDNLDDPLKNLDVLDIGCGGGILSVPFAKLGANVTSIDPVDSNIEIASQYAKKNDVRINFKVGYINSLSKKFDVVLNMEVIEHVEDYVSFLKDCASSLKSGGLMVLSTINRNIKSILLVKFAAEYILNIIPKGTHNWEKFLKPSEIASILRDKGVELIDIKGIKYNFFERSFYFSDNYDTNYISCFKKSVL